MLIPSPSTAIATPLKPWRLHDDKALPESTWWVNSHSIRYHHSNCHCRLGTSSTQDYDAETTLNQHWFNFLWLQGRTADMLGYRWLGSSNIFLGMYEMITHLGGSKQEDWLVGLLKNYQLSRANDFISITVWHRPGGPRMRGAAGWFPVKCCHLIS